MEHFKLGGIYFSLATKGQSVQSFASLFFSF